MSTVARIDLLALMESRRENMHISLSMPTEQIEVNAWDELQIDDTDLNTEFAAIPGQIAYWHMVTARVQAVAEAIRRDFDAWFAPLYEAEFTALHAASGKKPNINSAENQVRIKHPDEYSRRKAELDQVEADSKIIAGMVEALQSKLQALMQMAKRQLVEFDRIEPSVNAPRRARPVNTQVGYPKRPISSMDDANIEAAKDVFRRMRQGGTS